MSEKKLKDNHEPSCPITGKKTSIGGQALMEGIMMRGPEKTAMAIRNAKGEILLETFDTPVTTSRFKKLPFIRGIFGMISSLTLGYKCLMRSADVALADAEESDRKAKEKKEASAAPEDSVSTEKEAIEAEEKKEAAGSAPAGSAAENQTETEPASDAFHPEQEKDESTLTDAVYASAGNSGENGIPKGEDSPIQSFETTPSADAGTSAESARTQHGTQRADAAEAEIFDSVADIADTSSSAETETGAPTIRRTQGETKAEKSGGAATTIVMILGVALGLLLAVGLFIAAPAYLFKLFANLTNINLTTNSYGISLLRSVFEGVLKILILILYMFLVSRMKEIRRVFMYHGAEHKTIFCYEHGLPLTVENIRMQRRFHPRCGTSFLILVLLVSMVLGFFIPAFLDTWLRVLIKLLLLPLTVGIGYELIKLAGRKDNLFTRITSAPGLWLQRITTVEPDDGMIECAIAAMNEVIPEDKTKDNW